MATYFDAHTHVNFSAFKSDYKEVIERALDAGISMILVGTQRDTSRRAVEVAHEFPGGVYAAVGLHPTHTDKSFHDEQELGGGEAATAFTSRGEEFDFEYYKKLAEDPKVVAIGECGLDYFHIEGDREEKIQKQKKAFEAQIELAHTVGKPLMAHCRPSSRESQDGYTDTLAILEGRQSELKANDAGVIHFFVGNKASASRFLDLGFSLTFGGAITFRARKGSPSEALAKDGPYDEVIRFIPSDRILSETDAPYVAPVPYRGKRNEPAYVVEVVKRLAEIKSMPLDAVARQICANAKRIFSV